MKDSTRRSKQTAKQLNEILNGNAELMNLLTIQQFGKVAFDDLHRRLGEKKSRNRTTRLRPRDLASGDFSKVQYLSATKSTESKSQDSSPTALKCRFPRMRN